MNMQKRMIKEELTKLRVGDCGVRWDIVVWRMSSDSYIVDKQEEITLAQATEYIYNNI